jgi:hypothetical protein
MDAGPRCGRRLTALYGRADQEGVTLLKAGVVAYTERDTAPPYQAENEVVALPPHLAERTADLIGGNLPLDEAVLLGVDQVEKENSRVRRFEALGEDMTDEPFAGNCLPDAEFAKGRPSPVPSGRAQPAGERGRCGAASAPSLARLRRPPRQ